MSKRTLSLLAVASAIATAAPLQARGDSVPSDIAFIANQVADMINDPNYASIVAGAASSLLEAHGLPNQASVDQSVVSSLLAELNSQNNPEIAANVASDAVSFLQDGDIPTEVADLVSSVNSKLQDTNANTNIASVVDDLFDFIASVRVAMPSLFEDPTDGDAQLSPTSTVSSSETNNSSDISSLSDDASQSNNGNESSSLPDDELQSRDGSESDSNDDDASDEDTEATSGMDAAKSSMLVLAMGAVISSSIALF
ncbi:hypothetical protein H4R22_001263 [Coemansia sp. RSA 1290]|nr:hypothetical protein H4R22_001263 [Coemansia sp. RSA 1290]KAJ2650235.1 hypothetical protein IWW40_002608 [Coemansia sp. RSA 1250]